VEAFVEATAALNACYPEGFDGPGSSQRLEARLHYAEAKLFEQVGQAAASEVVKAPWLRPSVLRKALWCMGVCGCLTTESFAETPCSLHRRLPMF
jgi:hypothetical protein